MPPSASRKATRCTCRPTNACTSGEERHMTRNRQFLIDHLPKSKLTPDVFKLGEGAVPSPRDGEVLLRTRYISLDAANRAWMWGATYRAAVKAGDVMAGGALAEVVES